MVLKREKRNCVQGWFERGPCRGQTVRCKGIIGGGVRLDAGTACWRSDGVPRRRSGAVGCDSLAERAPFAGKGSGPCVRRPHTFLPFIPTKISMEWWTAATYPCGDAVKCMESVHRKTSTDLELRFITIYGRCVLVLRSSDSMVRPPSLLFPFSVTRLAGSVASVSSHGAILLLLFEVVDRGAMR